MPSHLEVVDLKVWIGDKQILHGINFSFKPSTVTAVMGPSGSGKSTLLRSLNRLIELNPQARINGSILLDGVDIFRMESYKVRRRIGMVFQEPNPFPHMSIYDNVALGPKLHGLAKTKKELNDIVEWALRKSMLWDEVKDKLHEPPARLSGGQRQRLSLARAIAVKPDVLLLDEPTANIDPVNTKKIEESIVELAREHGVTVILVTHTPQQAARVSDYILFIHEGRQVEAGPTRSLVLNPSTDLLGQYFRGEML